MGALIAFVLYLIFLKSNLQNSLPSGIEKNILDLWVIGGTLTITAITTSQNALGQMINDREKGQINDLLMTGIQAWKLQSSYLVGAMFISWLMQMAMFIMMGAYFALTDSMQIDWTSILSIILISVLSSLTWTSFNLLCLSFVKRVETYGKLSSIIATAAGFFAGVYMPISSVPSSAQWLMKLTPAPYNASLFRRYLMSQVLDDKFTGGLSAFRSSFETKLGITIHLQQTLSIVQTILIMLGFTVLFAGVSFIISRRKPIMTNARV